MKGMIHLRRPKVALCSYCDGLQLLSRIDVPHYFVLSLNVMSSLLCKINSLTSAQTDP